jgi:hypothetical protein
MTITIGLWAIPLAMTVAFFIAANVFTPPLKAGYYPDLTGSVYRLIALVASSGVWVLYLVLV